MKRVLFFLIIFYGVLHQDELTAQGIFQCVVNNHTRALDGENMYEKSLDSSRLLGWQKAILGVEQFVFNNSKKQKELLLNYFAKIHEENKRLINNIHKVYAAGARGTVNKKTCREFSEAFEKISKKMRRIEQSLHWVASKRQAENQAIEYVQKLAQYIAVTANKANRNLSIFNC